MIIDVPGWAVAIVCVCAAYGLICFFTTGK